MGSAGIVRRDEVVLEQVLIGRELILYPDLNIIGGVQPFGERVVGIGIEEVMLLDMPDMLDMLDMSDIPDIVADEGMEVVIEGDVLPIFITDEDEEVITMFIPLIELPLIYPSASSSPTWKSST